MSPMPEIQCPHCGRRSSYFSELAGREIFCLGCGSHFVVPRISKADLPPASGDAAEDLPARSNDIWETP
jgi:ribosomal protein S27E